MFDYSTSISERTITCNKDMFDVVTGSTKVQIVCKQIAEWHEKKEHGECSQKDFDKIKAELKKRLPVFLFHAHFKNGRRINSMAEPSGLCIFDLDHIGGLSRPSLRGGEGVTGLNTESLGQILRQHVIEHKAINDKNLIKKLKELGIVLAHITPSCEGLRLVFKIPEIVYHGNSDPSPLGRSGETPLSLAQRWLANELGEKEYDTSVKDYARCSFAVPKEYIMYISDELWAQQVGATVSEPSNVGAANSDSSKLGTAVSEPPAYDGSETVAPTSETLKIFDETVRTSNLSIENLNTIGCRHNSLITILSMGICRLMPKEQLEAVVNTRMPEYFQESDCRQLINDWYAKYNDSNRPMSRQLQRIFTNSIKETVKHDEGNAAKVQPEAPVLNVEAMPQALRASLITTPENLRLPVLISLLPLMGTYADGVEFDFLDNETTRLNMMSFVIGPQASGKSSCTRMQRIWMKPLLEMDEASRKAEDEWKEKDRIMGANEERPPRPNAPIRVCAATISNRMFHTRLVNAKPHTVYMFCPELDTMVNSNNQGTWANLYDKMRMSDDNDLWNMDYSNSDSLSELVPVRCNYSMLGTYGAFRRCFKATNIENGLATRVLIAEMPDNSFQPLVPYKKITAKQIESINDGIATLSKAKGHIECPRLKELIADWAEEKITESVELGDCVIDTFRRRTARIGMRIGVILELLEGKESDRILNLTRQLTNYVISEQIRIFGNQIKKIHEEDSMPYYQLSNKDLFMQLPDVFDYDDIKRIKNCSGSSALRVMMSRWTKNGKIKKIDNHSWRKI